MWDNNEATATATGLAAGTHDVVITDANGCTTTASVTITEPAILTASAVQDSGVLCNGESNGVATVTATGGTTGYTYMWDNNEVTSTATGLAVGTHDVVITDANGCTCLLYTSPSPRDS